MARKKDGEIFSLEGELKYFHEKGTKAFYGFSSKKGDYVIATEESTWYVAFLHPYYQRLMVFDAAREDGSPGTLEHLFESEPTFEKLEEHADKIVDANDQKNEHVPMLVRKLREVYGPRDKPPRQA